MPAREPGLNERVGLPKELEEHLRSYLELNIHVLKDTVNQLETAVGLITLFPEEADQFRQQAPVDKVIRDLTPNLESNPFSDFTVRGLRGVSQLYPNRLTLGSKVLEQELTVLRTDNRVNSRIALAASLACIFPDQKTKIVQEVRETVDELEKNFVWISDGSTLWTMRDALILDPSLHLVFKKFLQSYSDEFEQMFVKIKEVGVWLDAGNIATWFATYKLLLADEITLTPSGILLAVEKPDVSATTPLPERGLA